jgi:hypothetical protein
MNSKVIFLILAVVSASFLAGCSRTEAASGGEEVVFDEGYKTKNNEIIIDDSAFGDKPVQITAESQKRDEGIRTLSDKSVIETLVDGFGNRTETRAFPGHVRLRMVIVRTSIDNKQTVTVYGYGSDTKNVDEIANIALTGSADEIADKAKLTVTRSFKNRTAETYMKRAAPENQQLQPLPSSQFPVIANGTNNQQP